MSEWKRIIELTEIPQLGSRVVRSAKGDIAIFRNSENKVFALRDQCPHKGGPLSQGIVHGETVTCPLHGWNISLVDGTATAPDEGHTTCFEVKIDSGVVFLKI